ncbi:EF-P 5-aminopentanol modification-associated protein YfmF [Peribacillus castrilensis]|jgi:predicted Zn-dependent peptidase|uniref:Pitrilysin family protein n=2 Tax=Peribacillus TaxID=2675229 RepID=A0AAJ1VAU8_9BACI|nr:MULTISPECIES: pitrilysin family protein [Bacillaceae]MBL3641884.1 insulinase family protein [Bacillus sp. RHFB]MCD1160454.1 insulinase family protein [Peribacillus castrilensis]MCP1093112.1 insulinase family protein [Bacillaceae bacterium OS4b]QYF81433.1 insulinase family protein [Brevibacterium sp. PAMC21349]MBD8589045.1 insulinase family protein [Peribacillus simplex]
MSIASDTITEKSGYKLHVVRTDKYKTNTLVLKMKAPLTKEDVTYRALLPYVLQSNTSKYPTTPELRSYLDDLYGAGFYVDVAKKGEYQIISFTIDIVNEKFLSDSTPLLEKAFGLLSEVIFNPKKNGEAFDSKTVSNEIRSLKQRIQSISDDKMRYSATRLVEEMCKNEPYALEASGNLQDLETITPESLFAYYKKMLSEDEIDLYVIGDIDGSEVEALADKYVSLQEREPVRLPRETGKAVEKEKEIIENSDVKQGKLNIGYRTQVAYGDPDYYALQLFNGIFGGFSHSKLFINVREKASLAYYAASRLESHKGLLMVMAGIENANYKQALDIIHAQMKEMKQGNFSDEELAQTKAVVKNQLLETIDVSRGLVEILYHNVISGQDISLDEWFAKTERTTKEEIIAVGQKIQLDTIYFLTEAEVQG